MEYREWSVDLQEYIGEWTELPDDMVVDFGFFEADVPIYIRTWGDDVFMLAILILLVSGIAGVYVIAYLRAKRSVDKIPEPLKNAYIKKERPKRESFDQSGI